MRHLRLRTAGPVLLVALAAAALIAVGSTALAARKPFSGKLCSLVGNGRLSAVDVPGPCVNHKTIVTKGTATPVGRIRQRIASASAGHVSFGGRHLEIHVDTPLLSGAPLAKALAYFRSEVLSNGTLFSSRPLASVFMDTVSCPNPPISDCTRGKIMELVGHSLVIIGVYEPAIFVGLDDPVHQAVDQANDVTQESLLQPRFVAIGRAVAAGL